MRIFLTGGTGFIGSHFLEKTLTSGHSVLALRKTPERTTRINISQQPDWLNSELRDVSAFNLKDIDALVHLAAYGVTVGGNDWEQCFQVNVLDAINLWRKAISSGVKKFLIVGSCFEYGRSGNRFEYIPVDAPLEPTNAYAASKAAATMAALALAAENKLELIVVRPFHVYGPGESPNRLWPSLISAATTGENFEMTKGEQIRDFQHVQEAASQILDYLTSSNLDAGVPRIVNLGSGKPSTLLEFAEQEWSRSNAKGILQTGSLEYRENEVMRYVPSI